MLMLLFYAGENLYALDTSQVVEIIPMVQLRKIHQAPNYVAGIFNYRGSIVPVVDLCHLIQGSACRSHLSTRIIMVNYSGRDSASQCLGLMAERVTETLNKPDTELVNPGIQVETAPYLGGMIMDEKGMIQCIHWEHLLSESQHTSLVAAGRST